MKKLISLFLSLLFLSACESSDSSIVSAQLVPAKEEVLLALPLQTVTYLPLTEIKCKFLVLATPRTLCLLANLL